MSEIKKIDVGPVLTVPLALAQKGGQFASDQFQNLSPKLSALKEHALVKKITGATDIILTVLGLVLILHGAQFKNLFLCIQVTLAFSYGRIKTNVLALFSDIKEAKRKLTEDEPDKADAKAEAKPEANKHAQKRQSKKDDSKADEASKAQRETDAAATKKVLKVLDTEKVSGLALELVMAFVACHMVMQGGLAKVVVVAYALVKATKEKIEGFLDFSEHDDLEVWTELFLRFILYVVFGGMAVFVSPLAFALNLAICGAQLVTQHSLQVAECMKKIPGGESAEDFCASTKGLAMLAGLTAFGTLWQFWALMADNGMAWYFQIVYICPLTAEWILGLF
jgi:hypothetical protein